MKTQALVFVSNKVIWPSHERVKKNLTQCYLNSANKNMSVKKILIKDDVSFKQQLMKVILKSSKIKAPLHLVMLDIGLNLEILSQLSPFLKCEKVIFHFHVHGDLVIRLKEWQNLLLNLTGFNVSLRVCSSAMEKLCRSYFPKLKVIKIPFPIEDSFFESPLKKMKSPFIVSYFGRITPDKGLLTLLNWWKQYKPHNAELHLYGEWDHQTHLSWLSAEEFKVEAEQIRSLIAADPHIIVSHLKSRSAIKAAMDRSSVVVSFSLFKCEEYGLALREAAARGKSLILSNWAGHRDLAALPNIKLISVDKNLNLNLKKSLLKKSLFYSTSQRKKAFQLFSSKSITRLIKKSWYLISIINFPKGFNLPHEERDVIIKKSFL